MHSGRVIAGKYRVDQLIARGSMGEVYQGVHLGIGKRVAIKLMAPEYSACEEALARFRREARAAGALESEYILQVFDFGCDDEVGAFVVTELLVGMDLDVRLAREGFLEPLTAASIGYQVARGLAKAHAKGVIHRDLKPGNVFLAERDDGLVIAKILDFGLSKATCGDAVEARWTEDSFLTAAGITLGTPHYMSPEQALGERSLDGRSDVWSLGVTLYEALAGGPPFADDDSPIVVLTHIVHVDARPLADVAPWVPTALCDVVHTALVRDREKRVPDAATFARMLADALPCASASLSGAYPLAVARDGEVANTVRAPAPGRDDAEQARPPDPEPPASEADEPCPSSTEDRIEAFRRVGGGVVSLADE